MRRQIFDVIVVGGGHAGTEAALASARLGVQTLLLTHNIDTLGQLSCNPSIGGIGKSHLVKEIDALGGVMALAADHAGIQWRILNASKGSAVRATRVQVDRSIYKQFIRQTLEEQPNLFIFQQAVEKFLFKDNQIRGVVTQMGLQLHARAVVLTVGTFLAGKIHVGTSNYQAGRAGDPAALTLAEQLRELPLRVGRLKTGTPPRLDGRTLRYDDLVEQPSDRPLPVFSYLGRVDQHPEQVSCFITRTNEQTHEIIRSALDTSPLYNGTIEGIGPRYCPSIEDKVMRFSDKSSHQIFLEPEGLHTHEVYPNGISTSLSFDAQCKFVHSIQGLEKAHITRPGYAIEYDFFDPRDLKPSLESHLIENLFCAGQINGTTGYEEAAAQGIMAGLNAALKVKECEAWYPQRNQAYIGVLIDDLTTQGTLEPYRMFTSRAEYRLLLREDNADLRLTEKGYALGLVDELRWRTMCEKRERIDNEEQRLKKIFIYPQTAAADAVEAILQRPLKSECCLADLLRRPELTYNVLMNIGGIGPGVSDAKVAEQIEINAKYSGYLSKLFLEIERQRKHEETTLPVHLNYHHVSGLSTEVREKLTCHRPTTVGQASRIAGITPTAISLLLVYLKKSRHI